MMNFEPIDFSMNLYSKTPSDIADIYASLEKHA